MKQTRRSEARKTTAKAKKPKSSAKRSGNTSPKPRTAAAVATEAQLALHKAGDLHQNVRKLHEAAEAAHTAAHSLHERVHSGKPPGFIELEDDFPELIVEDVRPQKPTPFPVVGIGASAGGLEAFVEFLGALPLDTGMAFVLVQHLDPAHPSKLAELLAQTTKIPVRLVEDRARIKPNEVYVMPENVSMALGDGCLNLARRQVDGVQMPVDVFFRSLARQQQQQAIGIVLSGTGSDGTSGIEAIKGEGGITFAQDDRTARFFGMPGSAVASGAVDYVAPPAEIARELARISRHPYVRARPKPTDQSAANEPEWDMERALGHSARVFPALFGVLRARTGVDFSFYKQSTLKRRISRRMVLQKVDSLPDYVRMVETVSAETEALFNDLLVNVTHFFRDDQTFRVLKRKVFPRVLKNRPAHLPFRVWACGCSTGEEAYSLAISLIEFFEENYTQRQVQIFATDVSAHSIERARAGLYPESIAQDVSPERLKRFFTRMDGGYLVQKQVRDMCVFARQNVLADPPFSNLDLVSCRNVLIYFGPTLQRRVIPLFHYSLRMGGYLLLGSSETIGSSGDYFSVVDKKHKLYQKKTSHPRAGVEFHHAPPQPDLKPAPAPAQPLPLNLAQQVDRILLRDFAPGSVVVDANLQVVHFRGSTGDFLEHPPGQANLNVLKMARDSLVPPLRALLNKATREGRPIRQVGVELHAGGHVRGLSIEVVPFRAGPGSEPFFLVVFKDPETAHDSHGKPGRSSNSAREKRQSNQLRQELQETKESLQSIIQEQEATNEELRSANEEIQSSNEELQSTNEELETAKEELQATNEELSTLNEELQNRNTELSRVNNDLTNLLATVNVAVLMVGPDLAIRRFTPMAERAFNLIPSDVGRRLGELNHALFVPNLEAAVLEVMENLTPIEQEARDRDGRWYILRVRPYRTRENKIDGAVVLLVDLGELHRAIEVALSVTHQPMMVLQSDLRVRKVNEGFCALFGVTPNQVEGSFMHEAVDGQWNLPELREMLQQTLRKASGSESLEVEGDFLHAGRRRLSFVARRFFEDQRGVQLLLVGIQDLTNQV